MKRLSLASRNKAVLSLTLLFLLLHLFVLAMAGCQRDVSGEGLKVAVDIAPLAYLCEEVGGERVEVEVLLPPGSSPHTYELTAGQMKFLSQADLLVAVGLGLTPWAEDVFSRVDNPRLETVTAEEVLPPQLLVPASEAVTVDIAGHAGEEESGEQGHGEGEEHGHGEEEEGHHEHGHEHGVYDPHVWLDPELCQYLVLAVEEAFARADPDHASYYHDRARGSVEGLRALDAEIAGVLSEISSRRLVSFHSSLTYFARRYGLEQVGVIEELPGKEPSAGEVADLVDAVKALGVKAIFAERQFSPRAAQAIAEASGGGVVVATIDPLEDPGDPASGTYGGLMRELARTVAEALR